MKHEKPALVVIGGGAMGAALVGGVIDSGVCDASDIVVVDVAPAILESVSSRLGVNTTMDAAAAVSGADVLLIAVKPGVVKKALGAVRDSIPSGCLVLSIAAGVKIESLEDCVNTGVPVIRAMPNTPCQVGCGAVAFARGSAASDDDAELAKKLFGAVGLVVELPESNLDAVTGLSGSGPAYIFVLIEALSDAGVAVGLPRDKSTALAAQTVMGSAKMVLESGMHPAVLKDQVTSPGGTTIAGITALEKAGFRSAIIQAVKAASDRSRELG